MKTFEEYLSEQFWKQYTGLDDEAPEAENEWMGELEPDDWIDYAGQWVREEWDKKLPKKKSGWWKHQISPDKMEGYNQAIQEWKR